MKYLITGASGLLGSEVVNQCNDAISLSSKDADLVKSANIIHDIVEKNSVSAVIHCAARVGGVKANSDKVADFFNDNVRMNMNVLDACRDLDLKLVSILSTCIYPDARYVTYPLTEEQLHLGPPHPSNFGYAYAKRMLDVQSRAYNQQHNSRFITVVPNSLYGPNDNYDLDVGHVIPATIRKFYEAMMNNQSHVTIWGTGRPLREFTYSKDAASIILWLTENYDGVDPINIGNPEQVSIKDLAFLIGDSVGFKGDIIFDSSKPDGQFQKPSSNKRLLDLGWNGSYTTLEQGLKETIKVFKNRYPNFRGF
jgi:GDP-L-fucose synthase